MGIIGYDEIEEEDDFDGSNTFIHSITFPNTACQDYESS